MNNFTEILKILNIDDNSSKNKLEITSKSLEDKQEDLTRLRLNFESTKEGINIKLDEQGQLLICKTKEDALVYCRDSSFDKNILIIEDTIFWEKTGNHRNQFIENIRIWYKYNNIFQKIADYFADLNEEFILLSADKGKLQVGYSGKQIDHFDDTAFSQETFNQIENLINNNEDFISFFKDAFIDISYNESLQDRFSYAIKNIDIIFEDANRNYSLYKNKFSFEEFTKGLNHSKDEYLKNYQLFLSDFLSKISNLPVQIGVYIFLISRFSDVASILLFLLVLIIFVSIYSFRDISLMIENTNEMKDSCIENIKLIQQKSGIDERELEDTQNKMTDKLDSFVSFLKSYKHMNVAANVLFGVIIFYFVLFK